MPQTLARSSPALARPVAAPTVSARVAAFALIAGFAAFNMLYLLVDCPLNLAPDEAHYWDWSRRLDWSYYSKGPLVAWLIGGSCAVFGDTMPAVRFPAVLCNAALLLGIHRLAVQTFANERFALLVVALALTVPPLAAPAIVMTIDGPFLACWAWACAFAQRAVNGGSWRSWVAAGVVTAIGVLAKYTMLLFPACVGLFLLTQKRWSLGFGLMCAISLLGLVPILLWNAAHEWIGLRHVSTLAGGSPQSSFDPTTLPQFLASQFGLLVGYWFLAWVAAIVTFRPWRNADPRTAFLWWTSVPVFALFLVAAVQVKGQPNWPVAAYVPGVVLAVAWVARQFASSSRRYRRLCAGLLAFAIVLGLAMTFLARWPSLIRPAIATVTPSPSADNLTPVRKLDPTCRLYGWHQLAAEVDKLRDQVRAETGEEPIVATMMWNTPGELAFYCRDHPTVYTFGSALADRYSQYDLWRPNPVADAQAFRGRTFVYVGEINTDLQHAFDRCDPPVEVIASDGGIPVADWKVRVLRGYRGFPKGQRAAGY